MNSKVLVDTSVWVEYLRGRNRELIDQMGKLIQTQSVAICGIVIAELLAGVKVKKDREILKQTLDALEYMEASQSTWILAGEISCELMSKGTGIPLTDVVLAAVALENDVAVFTYDKHFDRIPKLRRFN